MGVTLRLQPTHTVVVLLLPKALTHVFKVNRVEQSAQRLIWTWIVLWFVPTLCQVCGGQELRLVSCSYLSLLL